MDQVQDAHERLDAAKAHVLGGVLNGIPLSHYTRKYTDYAGRARPEPANTSPA
jgi:hypothetical protein